MKLLAKRNLLLLAAIAVMASGGQAFLGGVNGPEPAFAQESEQEDEEQEEEQEEEEFKTDDFDARILHRVAKPRVTVPPSRIRGIRIVWNRLTEDNHTADVAPPGAEGALPGSYMVFRRTVKGGPIEGDLADRPTLEKSYPGHGYVWLASMGNGPEWGSRMKFLDVKAVPGEIYQYRLVIMYPNRYYKILNASREIGIGDEPLDIKQEAFQVNKGVRVRWKPIPMWSGKEWGDSIYRVERQQAESDPETAPWTLVEEVAHDRNEIHVKRLRITDTGVAPGTYRYRITLWEEDDTYLGTSSHLLVTVE